MEMHVFYVDVIQWMKINNFRDLAGPTLTRFCSLLLNQLCKWHLSEHGNYQLEFLNNLVGSNFSKASFITLTELIFFF